VKKFLALIAIALVVAAALWVIVRVQLSRRVATVPELLPKQTLLLLQAPDAKRSHDRWHESAVYQIWKEPSVQAWLTGTLGELPSENPTRKSFQEFLELGPTRIFLALTSLDNNEPKLLGGFHFDAAPAKAKEFLQAREKSWWPKSVEARSETILHGQHRIEKVEGARLQFASVYTDHWFFASNDVPMLKALLDRADHRADLATASLRENEAFNAAMKHLPEEYALLFYLNPQPFVEKLLPLITMTGQSLPVGQLERLKSIRGVASALGFDRARMRETDFIAMPRGAAERKLMRRLLSAAGKETFFYSVSRMQWPEQILSPPTTANAGLDEILRQLSATLASHGVTAKELRAAFGEELEMMGQWPAEMKWPTVVVTLPVGDVARARKIAEAVTSPDVSGTSWTRTDKEGAMFFSAQPFGGFLPITPTVAVSDKMLLVGSDVSAVESAMAKAGNAGGELEKSEPFKEAVGSLPAADTGLSYVDTKLLFLRADAALRPLLTMSAAIYPDLGRKLDVSRLPPAEAVAKHLSPIAMSQRYAGDGYLSESIGPVTFREATVGLAVTIGASFIYLREGFKQIESLQSAAATPSPTATATPVPAITPSLTPTATAP
jgi:hypothetical protein